MRRANQIARIAPTQTDKIILKNSAFSTCSLKMTKKGFHPSSRQELEVLSLPRYYLRSLEAFALRHLHSKLPLQYSSFFIARFSVRVAGAAARD